MPPNTENKSVLHENRETLLEDKTTDPLKPDYKVEILWFNVFAYIYLSLACLYGGYLCFFQAKWATVIFNFISYHVSGFGLGAGVHRLWAHRAYKAKLPLRIFLMLCNVLAYQYPVIYWARDHRVHHKHTETDADPHNAKRGFFFSHVGWLMCKKHPQVIEKGREIDISDLWADPVLRFQKKHYNTLVKVICFGLPTLIPMYFWGETFNVAFHVNIFRYFVSLNSTFLVNSAAHLWGPRPYDKDINPAENALASFLTMGEGWHNYHHIFPWDYKCSELRYFLNLSSLFIDFTAKLGLAYDLKTASEDMIKKRVLKTGDGSHSLWGWGDKDQTLEEKKEVITVCKKE